MKRMLAAQYRQLAGRTRSKMNNRRTTVDGITFDSKLEADYYCHLKLLQKAGEVTDFQCQVRFPLLEPFEKNGKKYRGIDYIADFVVTYADGRQEIIDTKGHKTDVYRIKKKWFEAKYPDLTIIEVGRR